MAQTATLAETARDAATEAERPGSSGRYTVLVVSAVAVAVLGVIAVLALHPPKPAPVVVGDTTIVATAGQLRPGITLVVPAATTPGAVAPVAYVFPPDGPFVVEPAATPTVPGARIATLKSAPGTSPAPGEHLAAVAIVGGASRQIAVDVTVEPLLPVVVILAGLIASSLISLYLGSIKPGKQLEEQAYAFLDHVTSLEEQRNLGALGDTWRFSIRATIQRAIDVAGLAGDDSIHSLIGQGNLQQARTALQNLRSLFTTYLTFLYSAADVYDAFSRIEEAVRGETPAPQAVVEMNALFAEHPSPLPRTKGGARGLPGPPTTVATVTRAIKDGDDLAELSARIKALGDLFVVFERANARSRQAIQLTCAVDPGLESEGTTGPVALSPDDAASLKRAHTALRAARHDLWRATAVDDLTTWKVEDRIETELGTVRDLAAKYGVPDEVDTHRALPRETRFATLDSALAAEPRLAHGKSTKGKGAPGGNGDRRRLRAAEFVEWGDAAIFVVSIVVALLTAATTLYVGKPFGSLTDYGTAFAWGFGVDQGVKGLAAVLGKLGVTVPNATSIAG